MDLLFQKYDTLYASNASKDVMQAIMALLRIHLSSDLVVLLWLVRVSYSTKQPHVRFV